MSAPSIVIFPQQSLSLEPSDKVMEPGCLPVEWRIKITIGEDFRTTFSFRDNDGISAYVTYGTRLTYWCVNQSTGTFLSTFADGTCASAEQALRDATDAVTKAREARLRRRVANATATVRP